MTPVPRPRPVPRATIEAIAQARASKAARLLACLLAASKNQYIDGAMVRRLDDKSKSQFIEVSGIKVASPDTWKCVEAAADAYAALRRDLNRSARLAAAKEAGRNG